MHELEKARSYKVGPISIEQGPDEGWLMIVSIEYVIRPSNHPLLFIARISSGGFVCHILLVSQGPIISAVLVFGAVPSVGIGPGLGHSD